jgi:2-(1,2-epoxy-1,2-dihydrophenyl)acetyl-CoA isomerase
VLEIDENKNYAIIYLNRPNQMNALNLQLAKDFLSVMDEIRRLNNVRSIIITGKGKAFCAGGDLAAFKEAKNPGEFLYNLAGTFHEGIKILKSIDAPSIAAVNGPCYGVGLSLACACDLRICSESAKFAIAFTNVGLSPDSSLTFHLPRIVSLPIANEMAFLNRTLAAEEALKYNLVSEIIPEASILEEARNIAIKVSQGATKAFGSTKKLFTMSFSNQLERQLEEEKENIRKNAITEDFKEGVNSFFEKRKPSFKGK